MVLVPECVVCLQAYDEYRHVPRLLGCGHSFCEICLKQIHVSSSAASSGAVIHCPECSHRTRLPAGGPHSLPKNFELLRLLPSLIRELKVDDPTDSTTTDAAVGRVKIKLPKWTLIDLMDSESRPFSNLRRSVRRSSRDSMPVGTVLASGESLVSDSADYSFTNQEDGNLCLYDEQGYSAWESGTSGKGRGDVMLLTDGNLVLFDTEGTGKPVWASMSQGIAKVTGSYRLVMQDDGNLVIYDATAQPTWASWSDSSSGIFTIVSDKAEMSSIVTWLQTCDKLVSSNGKYTFVNQGDGNLCIYNQDGEATWASGTYNKGAGNLYMQTDGDLVLYNTDGDVANPGAPIWNSGTARRGTGPYKLIMQDDGNLVIHDAYSDPTWASNTGAVWKSVTKSELRASGTLHSGESLVSTADEYTFVNQDDGNLVTYDKDGRTTWASGTGPGIRGELKLLTDGNLVLFDNENTGKPVWASMSQGTSRAAGPYRLIMQDDGNLVIYGANSVATWATQTLDTTSGLFADRTGWAEMRSSVTWLQTGDKLESMDGNYTFVNQRDGNLVIYNQNRKAIWSSGTRNKGAGNLYMQRDGDLVLYNTDGAVGSPGTPIWSSGTFGRGTSPYKLVMQNNGNLAIHDAKCNRIWTTRRSPTCLTDTLSSGDVLRVNEKLFSRNMMYKFVNQADGNLVIYNQHTSAIIWASGTNNQGKGQLYMQRDGNLVLYNTDGKTAKSWHAPIWSSKGEKGRGPYKLIMQDDGNLVIYDTCHKPTWASNTVSVDQDVD